MKLKRVAIDSDDETRKAMSCIIAVMHQNDITAKEAVLSYKTEMEEEFPYDYVELIRDVIKMVKRRARKTVIDKELIKKSSRLLKHEQLNKKQKDAYLLHSRKLTRYKRLGINIYKRNAQWSIDLADLNNLSEFNNQHRYLLVCVDIYSRYAFVKPLKTKTARNVANKFKAILTEENEIPLKVQSDEGVQLYKKSSILIIVERYNESPHRGLYNLTPFDVYKKGKAPDAFQKLKSILNNSTPTFGLLKEGTIVRIARVKNNVLKKSSLCRWVKEQFRIKKVFITDIVTYTLEDLKGEEIKGIFYRRELQTL
ncbi:uncharacterized transposon-derived [Paramuricea clavata]|uniref:Uncharacterized transposon-derived n=1 Tax=Paramuricea clavata TaxID=317549 RepID=A0A7D9D570_PARCT|nr:uncharacterized transposon-derived [Paramuricea clavata]